MKKMKWAMLVLIICVLLPWKVQAKVITVPVEAEWKFDDARGVFSDINNERVKKGKEPLMMDRQMTIEAMKRAVEISACYGHYHPDGTNLSGGKYNAVEIIARSAVTPEAAVGLWMSSEGHKENILRSDFKMAGVGCVKVNGEWYWTVLFSVMEPERENEEQIEYGSRKVTEDIVIETDLYTPYVLDFVKTKTDPVTKVYINTFCTVEDGRSEQGYLYNKVYLTLNRRSGNGGTVVIPDYMVTYGSSDTDRASVSSDGKITYKSGGSVQMTAVLNVDSMFAGSIEVGLKDHVWKYTEAAASSTASGYKMTSCKFCGLVKQKEIILAQEIIVSGEQKVQDNTEEVKPETVSIKNDSKNKKVTASDKVVVPKKPSIKKLKAGRRKFTIQWGRIRKNNSGYQVQYSQSAKFKSAKTRTYKGTAKVGKTISGLKAKKRYYVRVRCYRVVKGKKYYSAWSKVKSVKVR